MSESTNYAKVKSYVLNRKVLLGVTALVIVLITICLSSFVPYALKPENLRSYKFVTDLVINCAIVILSMVSSIFIGQASNANNPKSNIAKAIVRFKESLELVIQEGIRKFKAWIKQVQQPADIREIKNEILFTHGIEDPTILDLPIEDILKLKEGPKVLNNVAYPSITDEQAKILIDLKTNGVKVKLVPPEYYVNVKNLTDSRTITQRAANEGVKKAAKLLVSISSKLTLTIVFSSIFAMLAKDLSQSVEKLDAFVTLFFRLVNFFTSVFMGYLVGCQINDLDAEYIDMRHEIHKEFLEDKTFKVKDVKVAAMEEVQQTLDS